MTNPKPNKVLLATGGSRGLGAEMALAAARAGHDVIVTYRSNEAKACRSRP